MNKIFDLMSSHHFWEEFFNQDPVKERLEFSYISLEERKKHMGKISYAIL